MLVLRVNLQLGIAHQSGGRRGAGVPWFLVTAPMLALVAIWVIHTASLYHRQAELEVAAEASAISSAQALVDDLLLTDFSARQDIVEHRARQAGHNIAKFNHVLGMPVNLHENKHNEPCGELTIGTLANPFSRAFDASCKGHPCLYHPNRNAVRVALKRCGVAASATAFVDRDVRGFKIEGAMSLPGQSIPAIPVMPLALFTDPGFGCDHRGGHDRDEHNEHDRDDRGGHDRDDHKKQEECWESRDKRSWEFQILARLGGDRFRFDRDDEGKHEVRRCKDDERGDGIPEMHVSLRSGQHAHDNGQIALVGVETAKEAIDQLITGMTYRQLLPRDGQLLLGQDEGASTPRNELQLPRRQLSDAELDYLGEQLRRIIGQPRVWMLYSHTLEGHKEDRKSDGALNVVGFVAARVLAVNLEKRDDRHGKHEHANLAVVLQPCMMITANAVTDYRRRDLGPRTLFNPYVCKVRLVE